MKKWICIALLMLCSAASAEEWVSIGELRRQTPDRWTQTCETKWRTVAVDAVIRVPEVDRFPVMLLAGGAEDVLSAVDRTGWEEVSAHDGYNLRWNNPWPDYPSRLEGKRLDAGQYGGINWYSGITEGECYIPLSETTLGEILALTDDVLLRSGIDPGAYTHHTPFHMWTQRMFYYGKKKDALPGSMFVEFHAKAAGISVLSHIFKSVYTEGGWARDDEFIEYPDSRIIYHGYGEYLGAVSLWCARPVEMLAEDVPLCSFDTICAAMEAEINAGRIRKIYEIELGYVLYNEPGKFHAAKPGEARVAEIAAGRYYVRPMWQVNCLYKDTATGKLRGKPGDSDDERNTLDYWQLLIDAQTGEVVRRNNDKDRCAFPGFISWEDVR